MTTIKSFSVGNGDMFYIDHGSDNFTIIDCCLSDDNRNSIIEEVKLRKHGKGVTRFISTHPDDDHIRGLECLDDAINILNFYCTKNWATKEDESDDFTHYRTLHDSNKAFYIEKNCSRKWMNEKSDERGSSGIDILWPDPDHESYKRALNEAADGGSPNNLSLVIKYELKKGARVLWMGDLETDFMEEIADAVSWPRVDILFAPHHGRDTGKIPDAILQKMKPKIIVIGEAPSEHLNYYSGYNTITQNSAGNIVFQLQEGKMHVFVSDAEYSVDFLDFETNVYGDGWYVGTLTV